jgi:hypothetical protein
MSLTNDNMHLAARLWQAVLDASRVPEHQFEISMSSPDPVARRQAVEGLFPAKPSLPKVQFRGGIWMKSGMP